MPPAHQSQQNAPAEDHGNHSALSRRPSVGIVTVTHNSERFHNRYMASLQAQTTPPDLLVIVDAGSASTTHLDSASRTHFPIKVLRETNVGFSLGNNIGWALVRHLDYVLFLNPDAFLNPEFIQDGVRYMEEHQDVGMVTPTLLRYDLDQNVALSIVDSTGVIRKRNGLLAERDGGKSRDVLRRYCGPNQVPWVCAAVALARNASLESVAENGDEVFDNSFFMYREDTDLSWRLRRAGWKLVHLPSQISYHCRGWQDRKTTSRRARLLSARNEFRMCVKNRSPYALLGFLKYGLVRFLDI